MQVGGAQRRSVMHKVVHNVALTNQIVCLLCSWLPYIESPGDVQNIIVCIIYMYHGPFSYATWFWLRQVLVKGPGSKPVPKWNKTLRWKSPINLWLCSACHMLIRRNMILLCSFVWIFYHKAMVFWFLDRYVDKSTIQGIRENKCFSILPG